MHFFTSFFSLYDFLFSNCLLQQKSVLIAERKRWIYTNCQQYAIAQKKLKMQQYQTFGQSKQFRQMCLNISKKQQGNAMQFGINNENASDT